MLILFGYNVETDAQPLWMDTVPLYTEASSVNTFLHRTVFASIFIVLSLYSVLHMDEYLVYPGQRHYNSTRRSRLPLNSMAEPVSVCGFAH